MSYPPPPPPGQQPPPPGGYPPQQPAAGMDYGQSQQPYGQQYQQPYPQQQYEPPKKKRKWWLVPLILIGGIAVLLGGCIALLAAADEAVDDLSPDIEVATANDTDSDAGQDTPTTAGLADPPVDEDGNQWEGEATKPRDITAEVMAENEFNDPPPDGVVFAGTDITMTLVSSADGTASPGFDWIIKFEGPTQFYDTLTLDTLGCGVTPNGFDEYVELKPGGNVTGTYCIPVPAEDLDQLTVVLDPLLFGDPVTISP